MQSSLIIDYNLLYHKFKIREVMALRRTDQYFSSKRTFNSQQKCQVHIPSCSQIASAVSHSGLHLLILCDFIMLINFIIVEFILIVFELHCLLFCNARVCQDYRFCTFLYAFMHRYHKKSRYKY